MTMKISTAENLMRSTIEPRIRQQVIAANVAWNATNTSSYSGVPFENVPAIENEPSAGLKVPARNNRDRPPKNSASAGTDISSTSAVEVSIQATSPLFGTGAGGAAAAAAAAGAAASW